MSGVAGLNNNDKASAQKDEAWEHLRRLERTTSLPGAPMHVSGTQHKRGRRARRNNLPPAQSCLGYPPTPPLLHTPSSRGGHIKVCFPSVTKRASTTRLANVALALRQSAGRGRMGGRLDGDDDEVDSRTERGGRGGRRKRASSFPISCLCARVLVGARLRIELLVLASSDLPALESRVVLAIGQASVKQGLGHTRICFVWILMPN